MTCGAWFSHEDTCRWRLWAPRAHAAELVLIQPDGGRRRLAMQPAADGCFSAELDGIAPGQRYCFRLDGGPERPDPASRWQPDGVHAPSAVFDPRSIQWTDDDWRGARCPDLAIYELHVGTFTAEGTFDAVVPRLGALKELGISAIEIMPVGQFPGTRGWGYDGVYWYAVQNSYGGPAGLARLVNACHSAGLGVILDVVYNHLGPEGNYLEEFAPYFSDRYGTPWGKAVNFDDRGCDGVRAFVLQNVRQWVRDFHIDGLRIDAVHAIYDLSPRHILADIQAAVEEEAARAGRSACVIAESDLNDVRLLDPPERGGYGLDAQWSDDFHHSVHALLTGERQGYYADFDDPARQLVKAINETFVYDGCFSAFRGRSHGAPAKGYGGERFVIDIQTHDQVGNRPGGDRLAQLVPPNKQRLAAGLLLLAPYIPLLFMGEEYGETNPFPFFCDFGDATLREAVQLGRRAEFAAFAWEVDVPDPQVASTFDAAKLSWQWPAGSQRAGLRQLYADLLRARKEWPALSDLRHRQARLENGGKLLTLLRGDLQHPDSQILACFSLCEEVSPLPDHVTDTRRILLRSEDRRYGGTASHGTTGRHLAPFEFAVIGGQPGD